MKKNKSFTSMSRNTRYHRERRRKRVRFWAIMLRVLVVMVLLVVVAVVFFEIMKMEQIAVPRNIMTSPGSTVPSTPAPTVQEPADQLSELRRRVAMLESEFSMQEGLKTQLQEQVRDLSEENAGLRSELTDLEQLVAMATKESGITVKDLSMKRGKKRNEWRYRVLLVQGGNPKSDFQGTVILTAQARLPDGNLSEPLILKSSGKQDPMKPLPVKFKYYERLENTVFVPEGQTVSRLNIAVYRTNSSDPLITQSINLK